LATAAALSANFPPVFSNAAVDVTSTINGAESTTRYWVTDGGASENRGIISLLYALRFALEQEQKTTHRAPPRIHVLVVDASEEETEYFQDRGVGTVISAADVYASQLMVELSAQIAKLAEQGGGGKRFELHYVGMPDVLRTSGSFGTHWMLANTYVLRHAKENGEKERAILSGKDLKRLVVELHSGSKAANPKKRYQLSRDMITAKKWITEEGYDAKWAGLCRAIRE